MTKQVAIFGCGPSGLLAVHAAEMLGWDWRVFSRPVKSKLFGAQYLHKPILDLDCGTPAMVYYKLAGTPQEYRHKVYGPMWDGNTSPEDLMEHHGAWNIRSTYDKLWDMYAAEVTPMSIVDSICYVDDNTNFELALSKFDMIISTVPRKIWDPENPQLFLSQKIWAMGDTHDNERVFLDRPEPFTVMCDGTDEHDWYRISNVFGYCTCEWPYDGTNCSPARGASIVEKPLRTTSTARNDFVHLGRFGAWEKGLLTTDVFYGALKVLANDKIK